MIGPCCDKPTEIGTRRYRECTSCGMVTVNIDGLHRPNIAELIAREPATLF